MRVSLVRGAIAASTLIVWSGCSRMSLPPLWHPFAKDRANSESTAASSNAPAPPPVSGVARRRRSRCPRSPKGIHGICQCIPARRIRRRRIPPW